MLKKLLPKGIPLRLIPAALKYKLFYCSYYGHDLTGGAQYCYNCGSPWYRKSML